MLRRAGPVDQGEIGRPSSEEIDYLGVALLRGRHQDGEDGNPDDRLENKGDLSTRPH